MSDPVSAHPDSSGPAQPPHRPASGPDAAPAPTAERDGAPATAGTGSSDRTGDGAESSADGTARRRRRGSRGGRNRSRGPAREHPDGDHLDGDHLDGDHLDGDHSDGDHSDGEHSDADHPDGEQTVGARATGPAHAADPTVGRVPTAIAPPVMSPGPAPVPPGAASPLQDGDAGRSGAAGPHEPPAAGAAATGGPGSPPVPASAVGARRLGAAGPAAAPAPTAAAPVTSGSPAPDAAPGSVAPPTTGPAAGIPSPAPPPRPRIGDSRPAPPTPPPPPVSEAASPARARPVRTPGGGRERRAQSPRGGPLSDADRAAAMARGTGGPNGAGPSGDGAGTDGGPGANGHGAHGGGVPAGAAARSGDDGPVDGKRRRRGGGRAKGERAPVEAVLADGPTLVDEETLERRRGRERKGRPVGRYQMVVHSAQGVTQIAVLEGRSLIEHYVSRPSDDANQIDGNVYLGRVQNVLPGMEAAFVDIGTPKNAVIYRGDVRYDRDDVDGGETGKGAKAAGPGRNARIEQLLKPGQTVLCQVTKNPIAHKGARLAQEVSLPGRFVVLIPHSDTYGISKRLADDERKRLRRILDDVRPEGHGLIVRTAAEGATAEELRRDVARLVGQWDRIDALAKSSRTPALLYREPDMAVRVIREEFNKDYRSVVIDDRGLYEEVRDYVATISPELADRVEFAGDSDDPLPAFERHHVHEQIHKALDRKVWLPSGGSLIIERTEALTVIDVNTGKNVGTSNLEETVYRNNLEAAEEIARQLRLRDIGGIIVIDFVDMEIVANRGQVIKTFREALARDKTRTQVFDISELGLVEMTRKRISEGLVESFSQTCPTCAGRGFVIDDSLL
jgi:ribonuclease E